MLLSSLPYFYHNLVNELLIEKDILKMEDAIFATLENEKLRKPTIESKGTTYIVSDDHGWSAHHNGNTKKKKKELISLI